MSSKQVPCKMKVQNTRNNYRTNTGNVTEYIKKSTLEDVHHYLFE